MIIPKHTLIVRYLDAAIAHGAREAAIFGFESDEMLTSRNLRGRCYLNLSRLREAQAEAEQVLKFNTSDGTAVLIMAEALYLQCRVRFIAKAIVEQEDIIGF